MVEHGILDMQDRPETVAWSPSQEATIIKILTQTLTLRVQCMYTFTDVITM